MDAAAKVEFQDRGGRCNEELPLSRWTPGGARRGCSSGWSSYEQLIATEGVGPKTVRALSLVGEVIYGAQPSYEDPARYSFAHGGKDATPYPVDRTIYDQTIATLIEAVRHSHMNPNDKDGALKRLADSAQDGLTAFRREECVSQHRQQHDN